MSNHSKWSKGSQQSEDLEMLERFMTRWILYDSVCYWNQDNKEIKCILWMSKIWTLILYGTTCNHLRHWFKGKRSCKNQI